MSNAPVVYYPGKISNVGANVWPSVVSCLVYAYPQILTLEVLSERDKALVAGLFTVIGGISGNFIIKTPLFPYGYLRKKMTGCIRSCINSPAPIEEVVDETLPGVRTKNKRLTQACQVVLGTCTLTAGLLNLFSINEEIEKSIWEIPDSVSIVTGIFCTIFGGSSIWGAIR